MNTTRRYDFPVLILILLVGYAVRVWALGHASLWIDEIVTAQRAQDPLKDALGSILGAGNQVPLYYLPLRLLPTHTELLLRLPSAWAGMIGIALIVRTARRLYGDTRLALWAGMLLTANPFHVWLSRTARPYALLFALGLLASYLFLRLVSGRESTARWIAFTLSSAAVYLTHYFAVLLPCAQLLFLIDRQSSSVFKRRWIAAQLIAGLPVLLWVGPLALIDLATEKALLGTGIDWIPAPTLADLPLTVWNLAVGYDGRWSWAVLPALLAVSAGLIVGLVLTVRRPTPSDRYWSWLVILPLPVIFTVSSLLPPVYVDRYFMLLLPGILLIMLRGWALRPGVQSALAAVVLLTGLGIILGTLHTGQDEKIAWRAAAAYLQTNRIPGDGLVIAPGTARDPLTYYGIPESLPVFEVEADSSGLRPVEETSGLPPCRLWAVLPNPRTNVHRLGAASDFDPFEPGTSLLGDWLIQKRDAITRQVTFNGIYISLVECHAPPR